MEHLSRYGVFDIDGSLYSREDILDLYRLQTQLLKHRNLVASLKECADIWIGYSSDLHAGWLFFPKDDEEIIKTITNNDYFVSFNHYINK